MRDNFSQVTKDLLARRVAYRCSNPLCVAITCGPHTEASRYVNVGVASHISAAAVGGPRYSADLTPVQRSSSENGIWLCQNCAKLIDSDIIKFSVDLLVGWKVAAEQRAIRELTGIPDGEFFPQAANATHTPIPRITGLTYDDARALLVRAGWQPSMNHWTHAQNFDMQYGNGLHYWSKGYHEIRHASGTGIAMCSFGFEDVYVHKLVIVTAGEVIEGLDATAYVWRWYFEREGGDA